MVSIKAHFDGKALIPNEPVDLPQDRVLVVHVEVADAPPPAPGESVLDWILKNPITGADLPSDLAHEHDHYLYGTPKKGNHP